MKKTLTLPESEIITLTDAAKKHGTVELAKAIGIGKTQLYKILRGHNRLTPETADKISVWLDADAPKPGQLEKPQESPTPPTPPTPPTKSELLAALRNPEFQKIAVVQLCKAVLDGRLKGVSIVMEGMGKCGD